MQAGDLQYTSATYHLRIPQSIFSHIVSREDFFAEFTFPLLIYECVALYVLNLFYF